MGVVECAFVVGEGRTCLRECGREESQNCDSSLPPSDHDCAGVHAQGRPEKLPVVKTTTVGYSL